MSFAAGRSARRWAVPAAVAGLVAALAGGSALPAGAVDLPDLTPEQVLVLAQGADVRAWSGTVRVEADLGLPELPGATQGAADPLALLSGDTELRLWVDGAEEQRLQVLRRWSQLDVVRHGDEVWTYDSAEDVYRRAVFPSAPEQAGASATMPPSGRPAGRAAGRLTPEALARHALDAVAPSTEVTVGDHLEVAGREAYELRLAPRTPDTLVGRVAVAVDAQTGMALRVSVTARGAAEPSLQVGYTSLDLSRPSPERFEVRPRAGATVQELVVPAPARHDDPSSAGGTGPGAAPDPAMRAVGSGWAAVLERAAGDLAGQQEPGMLDALTRRVEGGRALSSDLVSALLTDDGRLLVGAVPVEALVEAAR